MADQTNTLKIAFAVTEVGPEVAAGDYFTALELGSSLRKLIRWEVVWLPKADWYNVGDADVLIAMTDHYDLTSLGSRAEQLVKICWMRNWFDRWAGKPHFGMWDIRLCSSRKAADHIEAKYGFKSSVLRIATNHRRFKPRPEEKIYDYVFTGSYWSAPRDIEHIDPKSIGLRFALFGKNWEDHAQFKGYYKGFAPYHALSRIYNQSRLLVDDANSVTKEWGSVNSRVFDALASGTLVITNSIASSSEVFNNNLPVYESPNALRETLTRYLDDPQQYKETLETLRSQVLAYHTYDIRSQELAKIILNHLRANHLSQVVSPQDLQSISPTTNQPCLVSIVIPVYNQVHFTAKCLEAIYKNTPNIFEIIIIDNGSTDGTAQLLAQYAGRIRVVRSETNQGFARACNSGAAIATAPFLLFLNNDTEVLEGWLPPLLAMAMRPNTGAVGSRLLFPDGTVQHAGVVIVERRGITSLLPRHAFMGDNPTDALPLNPTLMQAVTAACMLVNATCFHDAGGFDTAYWNGCEDVDLCFKLAQLGRKIVYEPSSIVVHHEGKSGHERKVSISVNNARLRARWEELIAPDLIDEGGAVVLGEGFASRLREGGELAPDAAYGEALTAWWGRYRARHYPPRVSLVRGAQIAVRICTPSRNSKGWGDTAFGQDLSTAFTQLGYRTEVQFKDEWRRQAHDITIHIRGVYRHYPRLGAKNVLWIISHPELITKEELDSYNLVLCASASFLRQIAQLTATPCHYLPQAASSVFTRKHKIPQKSFDMLFIGNNYAYKESRRRKIVQDVLDAGLGSSLRVIGRDWQRYLPSAMLIDEYVPQEMLPHYYGMARINLNDHHPAMAREGFINNRTFDIGALGLFQISNMVPGIETYGVVTYANTDDLRHKIEYFIGNDVARESMAQYSHAHCSNEIFNSRAKSILQLLNNL